MINYNELNRNQFQNIEKNSLEILNTDFLRLSKDEVWRISNYI